MNTRPADKGLSAEAPLKDLYEIGEIPPLGHVPKSMYAWAVRKERHGPPEDGDEDRGRADLDARQPRRAGPRDGGRRQLQRRLGCARRAGLRARRAQEPLSYRRLRRLRHRLGGRLQGQALESRRRGRRPLQPGRRRRRGMQRRRPDVLRLAAHLGLRDAGRLVRAVLPGAGPPADGAPEAPDLGGGRLLHADAGDRLPHAVRPRAPSPAAERQRARVGRLGRPRRVRRPALRRRRRQCHRRHIRRDASATT